jgi:predicted amidohydrolase YtcJ
MRTLFILLFAAAIAAAQPADLVLYNGKIVTGWAAKPVVNTVAIRGGKFVAVGEDMQAARRIDLKGRTVLPGLIDSHTHPISSALSEKDAPIPVMESIADVQKYIRAQATRLPPGKLIIALKVYSTRLKERRYPTRWELDKDAPDRAAMTDNGYASVLNSFLLKKLNITRDTPQPANGKIIKDANGEPTGLILGATQILGPLRASAKPTHADRMWALKSMQQHYNAVGITSTIDRGQTAEGFRVYQELHRRGELTVRSYVTQLITAQGSPQDVRQEIERLPFVTGFGDDMLRVGSLKVVLDGGILIGTALLREPYGEHTEIYGYKDPHYRGVQAVPRENLFEMARVANELGWQMTAHTAGGGATDLLLDAYENTDRDKSILSRRFTVTHGNFPDARAIARSKKLGIVYDCQPAWHHFDGQAIAPAFGPRRMKDFLPLRSLFDAGIVVAGGSDHMIRFDSRLAINPYNPFFGMWMAITRRTSDGGILGPEQAITREEALRMWTWNGAYLSFEESSKGSIEPGKLADLVVVSKDFLLCPVDEIKDMEALATIVGGKVVSGRLE